MCRCYQGKEIQYCLEIFAQNKCRGKIIFSHFLFDVFSYISSSRTIKSPCPTFVVGSTYKLTCRACGSQLGQLKVGRVLPAPRDGWRHGATNWFCCVNRLAQAPDLALRETDVLYGPATVALHRAMLGALVVSGSENGDIQHDNGDTLNNRQQHGLCPSCRTEIGTFDEEAIECWYAALGFSPQQEDSSADNQAMSVVHPAGAGWCENFLAFLAARIHEVPDMMPKLTVRCHQRENSGKDTRFLHLWVVDRQLTILRSDAPSSSDAQGLNGSENNGDAHGISDAIDDNGTLSVQTVAKVLFKLNADGKSVSVEPPVEVAEQLFLAGQTLLEDACRHFPESVRVVQDYQVAFVPL